MKNHTVRQRFTGLSTVALATCLGVGMLAAPSRAAEPRTSAPAAATTTAASEAGAPEPGGPAAQSLTAPVQDPGHVGGTP